MWTEALGRVFESPQKPPLGEEGSFGFVTHLRSGRRQAYDGLGLSLSGSTKCGGGRQREGLPGHWLSEKSAVSWIPHGFRP